jgi:uncharacterized membrane protein SpoIIM required for sporulation
MVVGFFPITVSLVIALEAFVGEKERGTIEPLLITPLKDGHLYIGKLISGTIGPVLTAYVGISVYLLGLHFRHIPLPDGNRLMQTITLTTIQAILMVSAAMLISTQATSIRAANLMASFIVIPVAILVQGESVMLFWGNNQALWLAVIGVGVLTGLLIRLGLAHFQRESLLGREIDFLNLRWALRTFWMYFTGKSRSLAKWYQALFKTTLRKQMPSILLTILIGVAAFLIGTAWVNMNSSELINQYANGKLSSMLSSQIGVPFSLESISFLTILGHNLRALLVILLLGLLSFGVMGMLIYLINIGLIGGILALIKLVGESPVVVGILGILPHGIFELPALILASAAVLHIGVVLVTPRNISLGEVLLEGLADWMKVTAGIVLPLIIVAAAVETWLTPILLSNVI